MFEELGVHGLPFLGFFGPSDVQGDSSREGQEVCDLTHVLMERALSVYLEWAYVSVIVLVIVKFDNVTLVSFLSIW